VTRDELLADINKYYSDIESGLRWEPDCYIKALRAVVELHKPSQKDYTGEIGCVGCDVNSEYGTWQEEYPCPTIQAIEKELQ
jgi:hypothetical protein